MPDPRRAGAAALSGLSAALLQSRAVCGPRWLRSRSARRAGGAGTVTGQCRSSVGAHTGQCRDSVGAV